MPSGKRGPTPAGPTDSVVVVVPAPIDVRNPAAPVNAGERFVFAQVYETLIDVDCAGRVLPALAQSWTHDATGTRVTVVLRAGARFSAGDPVTTRDVIAAWRATAASPAAPATSDALLARRIADGATIVDDRTLTLSLPDSAWRVLAEPALAVYRPRNDVAWGDGSGRYRIDGVAPGLVRLAPVAPDSGPPVLVRFGGDADARDAIDAGDALVLSAAPRAVSYAASHAGLASVALPWDRTYVVVAPGGASSVLSPAAIDSASGFRTTLARDAVRAESRAAEPPYWWSVSDCTFIDANDARPAPVRAAGIGYRADDAVARDLADRLVALRPGLAAVSLEPDEFARALRAGRGEGFVLAVPRESLAACRDVADLLIAAPWLIAGNLQASVVPLVDTRRRVIFDPARVSAHIDWDGTLRLRGAAVRP
ncbi:MAG: ABC transporter substrate-binding protein [Gemmatimonadales bacterium]